VENKFGKDSDSFGFGIFIAWCQGCRFFTGHSVYAADYCCLSLYLNAHGSEKVLENILTVLKSFGKVLESFVRKSVGTLALSAVAESCFLHCVPKKHP